MPTLVKNVSEPWFSLIAAGLKTVEGRLKKGDFAALKIGDVVAWTNDQFGFARTFRTQVSAVRDQFGVAPTFEAMLKKETLAACLPAHGVATVSKGVRVYRQFFDRAAEKKHGVLAISLTKI